MYRLFLSSRPLFFFLFCIVPITRSWTERTLAMIMQEALGHTDTENQRGGKQKLLCIVIVHLTLTIGPIVFAAVPSPRLITTFCKSFSVKVDREWCWKKGALFYLFFNAATVNRTLRAFSINSLISSPLCCHRLRLGSTVLPAFTLPAKIQCFIHLDWNPMALLSSEQSLTNHMNSGFCRTD